MDSSLTTQAWFICLSLSSAFDQLAPLVSKLHDGLSPTSYPIIMIEIKMDIHPNYHLKLGHDINHWVVITGFSQGWDSHPTWNPTDSDWKWVRIFNPVVNGTEYYKAQDIWTSHDSWKYKPGPSLNGSPYILWISK